MQATFKTTDGYQLTLIGTKRDPENPQWLSEGEDLAFDSSPVFIFLDWVIRVPLDCDGEMLCGELTVKGPYGTNVFKCFQDWADFGNESPESITHLGQLVWGNDGVRYVI